MPKDIAVLCSDTHLQTRAWANKPIEGDSYHSFTQIISYACSHRLPVIGAGDLIDRRVNDPAPIRFLVRELTRLEDAGQEFYFIQGQHELDETPWMSMAPNAVHLHNHEVEIQDLRVRGVDFQPADKFKAAFDAAADAKPDLLVAHQVWQDFMGERAGPQGAFSDVGGTRFMLTGDFHERKTVSVRGRDGQLLTVYSLGSTCMQDIAEPTSKYFAVLQDNLEIRYVSLKTRPVIDVGYLDTPERVDKCLDGLKQQLDAAYKVEGLPEHIRKPLLRFAYGHDLPDTLRRITRLVDGRAHLFPKELPPKREDAVARTRAAGRALTLEGCLPTVVDPEEDPELYKLALRVLTSKADPAVELAAWAREVTVDVI